MKNALFVLFFALLVNACDFERGRWWKPANADGCNGNPNTFVVTPSGADDTTKLQATFDEVAGIEGVCVQFAAGQFSISRTLRISNFYGEIHGRGADQTIIRTGVAVFPTAPEKAPPTTGMIAFVQDKGFVAHILVTDIGFEFDSESRRCGRFDLVFRSIITLFGKGEVRAKFADLAMTGNGSVYTRAGIEPWGDHPGIEPCEDPVDSVRFLRGSVTVVRSTFRDMISAVNTQAFAGNLTIGGSERNGNFAEGVSNFLFTHDFDNSIIEVSHNEAHIDVPGPFGPTAGIVINSGFFGTFPNGFIEQSTHPSTVSIHSNRIEMGAQSSHAISVVDQVGRENLGQRLSGEVKDNVLITDSAQAYGVDICADDFSIASNKITGNGTDINICDAANRRSQPGTWPVN